MSLDPLTPHQNFSGSCFLLFQQVKQKDWQKEVNVRGSYCKFFGGSKKNFVILIK
jgi:hypothetical protein